jgi:hypothetical protein
MSEDCINTKVYFDTVKAIEKIIKERDHLSSDAVKSLKDTISTLGSMKKCEE